MRASYEHTAYLLGDQEHDADCFCWKCIGEAQPPVPSNTGGLNRQISTTGGIDTLLVWLMGAHGPEFLRILPELEECQEYAKSKATEMHASLTVNGRRVRVGGRGVTKAQGVYYFDFKLEWDGIVLLVMKDLPGDRHEIAFVEIGSFRLMRDGHEKCWKDALGLAEDIGLFVNDNKPQRGDVCVDLPGVSVEPFCQAYARRDFIARARSGSLYDEGVGYTGFCRGKGGLLIRVYEKLVEMLKGGDRAKLEVLKERRWGGVIPEQATRVEFQMRWEWLSTWGMVQPDGTQMEIRTVEDLFAALPTLTQYLVEHWFRIVDDAAPLREHGNQARAKAADIWLQVVDAFASWVDGEVAQLVRKPSGYGEEENKLRQIAGLVASVTAATPEKFRRSRDILQRAMAKVEALCGKDLVDKVERRRCDLEATGRGRWYDVPLKPLCRRDEEPWAESEPREVDYAALPF